MYGGAGLHCRFPGYREQSTLPPAPRPGPPPSPGTPLPGASRPGETPLSVSYLHPARGRSILALQPFYSPMLCLGEGGGERPRFKGEGLLVV